MIIILLHGKQLNLYNKYTNSSTTNQYVNVADLRGLPHSENLHLLAKINITSVQKFYVAMDYNSVNNTELYNTRLYPFNVIVAAGRQGFETPQINNITLMMSSSPVLFNWNNIPNVSLIFFQKKSSIENNLRILIMSRF